MSQQQSAHSRQRTATATRIRVQTPRVSFEASLNDSAIANTIKHKLPITSIVRRWGDEIYFDVPVKLPNTRPTLEVRVGDIAYWPDGPCLCIFFGKTPASRAQEPRPASEVTVIGHTEALVSLLRSINAETSITLDHASPTEDQTV